MPDLRVRNETSVPLTDVLANRWSSRAFDAEYVLAEEEVLALVEAARWAPSANNLQPRRFVAARRGTRTFQTILDALAPFNRVWAGRASLLVVAIAEVNREGSPLQYAHYDTGQAVAHLTVEAVDRGLNVRQMGGFRRENLIAAFELTEDLVPLTVVAVGKHDPVGSDLPTEVQDRELLPRERKDLAETALLLDL